MNDPDLTLGKKWYEGEPAVLFENFAPSTLEDFREMMAHVGLPTEKNVITDQMGKRHLVPFMMQGADPGCAVVVGETHKPFLVMHGPGCGRMQSVLDTMTSAEKGAEFQVMVPECETMESGEYAFIIDGEAMRRQGLER